MQISAIDKTLLWAAIREGALVVTGVTVPGDTTASAELVSAESEPALLGALASGEIAVPPLPGAGEWLSEGDIYEYTGSPIMVRQSHARTIYAPEDTPALFVVWRGGTSEVLEWTPREQVYAGTRRTYDGVLYECIQAHVTQDDWTPPATPALWRVVTSVPGGQREWSAGVAYKVGDRVTYQGAEYECRQAHTSQVGWEPPKVLALWLPL